MHLFFLNAGKWIMITKSQRHTHAHITQRVKEKFSEGIFFWFGWRNQKTKQSIVTFLKNDRFLLFCLSNQIYCSKNIDLNPTQQDYII